MIQDSLKQKIDLGIQAIYSSQKIQEDGRIHTPKKGWILRVVTLSILMGIICYNLVLSAKFFQPLLLYSTITLIDAFIITSVGWFFYKNPARGIIGNELVSILIPVYNQKNMISIVIDAIINSTYKNIEIIAVNDGSSDGSKEILNDLAKKYSNLRVFHKRNEGKRKANFLGFSKSRGKFVIFIDSDSVIDKHAITEMMKAFNTNPDVGALVGHIKAWNSKNKLLPKLQDAWYDFEFNIVKSTQSTLDNVLVCSGCFAGYRRNAIEKFVPLWNNMEQSRICQKYFKTNPWKYWIFSRISLKILEWASQYDDAEDSVLTVQTLVDWKVKYVSSSVVYTEVPENLKKFTNQQVRWKKGSLRALFFAFTFFWKKNPMSSFMVYFNLLSALTTPFILFIIFYYGPFVLNQSWFSIMFFSGFIGLGIAQGIDYKLRDSATKNWKYRPLMNIIIAFVFPFLIIPALLTFKKNQWLTR